MKLYNFAWGPYPRRIAIYLAEKRLDLATVDVEFPHRPELWPPGFLQQLNPNGSLPVLDVGDGTKIGQSLAIIEYLEERFPSPNLMGESPEARARTREIVAVLDEATSFFGIWARQGSRLNADRHKASAEAAAVGAERFGAKLRVVDRMVAGPFLAGDSVSVADVIGLALLEFTQGFYGVPIPPDCGQLQAWYDRCSKRASIPPCAYPSEQLAIAYGLPQQTQTSLSPTGI